MSYQDEGDVIKPQYVVEMLDILTGGDAIITTEVGQNQMWAAQFYKFNKPRHWADFRRTRHHGLWPAGRHRRPDGLPG